MSTKTVYESDLSGAAGAEPVALEVGTHGALEVDLTLEEQDELDDLLRPYLSVARSAVRDKRRPQVPEMSPEERVRIRTWASQRGLDVASRGRVPRRIRLAYDAAHGIHRPRFNK